MRMEITNIEIAAVEMAAGLASNVEITELNELQLALIGGGTGEVSLG
jgi:hypothetical protein